MSDHSIAGGEQPYDDRHNAPPRFNPFDTSAYIPEGAMDRNAELPPPGFEQGRTLSDVIAEPYAGRWGSEVDPRDVESAIAYLTNHLPTDTEALRPFNACVATVLNELLRLREPAENEIALGEPVEDEITIGGLHYFLPDGAHITDLARWSDLGQAEHASTLDLRVLAAHLTTALDGINRALGKRF